MFMSEKYVYLEDLLQLYLFPTQGCQLKNYTSIFYN